jgi:hypothetical protein
MFFISVDFEGFRCVVSCLESTLVGWLVSVAFKWFTAELICLKGHPAEQRDMGVSRKLELEYGLRASPSKLRASRMPGLQKEKPR